MGAIHAIRFSVDYEEKGRAPGGVEWKGRYARKCIELWFPAELKALRRENTGKKLGSKEEALSKQFLGKYRRVLTRRNHLKRLYKMV